MSIIDTENLPDDCTVQDVTDWSSEQLGNYINLSLDQGNGDNLVLVVDVDGRRMVYDCLTAP
jgi:hypothetical protein